MIINALINNTPIFPTFFSRFSNTHLESFSSSDEESEKNIQFDSKIDDDTNQWRYHLVKALISTYDQMYGIIRKYHEVSANSGDNVQQGKIELELTKMALLLNPIDLLIPEHENDTVPCVDVPGLVGSGQGTNEKHPAHHKNFLRWKIDRILTTLASRMERLRSVLFASSYQTQLISRIHSYRNRIEKSRNEIREHIHQYNHLNAVLLNEKCNDALSEHFKSLEQILNEITAQDPLLQQRIEDYRLPTKSNECQDNEHDFFSSSQQSPPSSSKTEDHLSSIASLEFTDF